LNLKVNVYKQIEEPPQTPAPRTHETYPNQKQNKKAHATSLHTRTRVKEKNLRHFI
jgi:hypothetical protein